MSSLKNGINNYLSTSYQHGGLYGTVTSCSYSYDIVKSNINYNKPISLGTNGGGLATGGHVQTIHGYKTEQLSASIIQYTLYVNNSWGDNNIALTYINTPPTYLKDHVYFTN